ncbi:MAG: hypothetical protein AAGJ31_01000, partial [Verrucomicrobiota bacterium]
MRWKSAILLWVTLLAGVSQAQLPTGDVHGYVYIEPFELRKEFAIKLSAFPEWAPGLLPEKGLSAAEQAEVLTSLNTILGKACPLTADNADPDLQLEMIRFVQVEPEFGVIPDEREIIPLHEAQIAAVYAAAREGYPDEVSIQWNLFPSSSAEGIEA